MPIGTKLCRLHMQMQQPHGRSTPMSGKVAFKRPTRATPTTEVRRAALQRSRIELAESR